MTPNRKNLSSQSPPAIMMQTVDAMRPGMGLAAKEYLEGAFMKRATVDFNLCGGCN